MKRVQMRGLLRGFFIMSIIVTTETAIERFKEVHGDTYDYSEVNYKGAKEKVIIICNIHGKFKCSPDNHKRGRRCPKCAGKNKTTEEVICMFKDKHGDRYDYSLVEYKTAKTKVKIKCYIHGYFYQDVSRHADGRGCQKCVGLNKNTEEVVEEFKKIHFDRYCYDSVEYINNSTKVIIICKEHGLFKQTPGSHLSRNGCPKCGNKEISKLMKNNPTGWTSTNWGNKAKLSKNFDSFKVYVIKCTDNIESFYKIGRTYKTIKQRFVGKYNMPYNYATLHELIFNTAKEAFDCENELKRHNKEYKYLPEKHFNGKFECFSEINL